MIIGYVLSVLVAYWYICRRNGYAPVTAEIHQLFQHVFVDALLWPRTMLVAWLETPSVIVSLAHLRLQAEVVIYKIFRICVRIRRFFGIFSRQNYHL